ncbi:SusC/RagA family TonB-linked outer membrane protein [Elizabethkingia argentiflava]|uniref:SusC/RagA family TonB-linked outer membrane protein n=1 Tax=Elizabethkingia argenteiflava TaxID=2681556 RepID=A0A845PZS5_9FLAO|nr:SusC/RagA family TonB-linked outer membrane protein [Elizabethkingia argenteiflava]NAW51937.1 SusC/RagA family TonB-linked outer membrane protein [Elizabethkingia argenteiflava]
MKKLINSVLAVVLSSSFVLVSAQKKKKDSTKTTDIEEVVVTALGIKREKKALGYASQEIKGDILREGASTGNLSSQMTGKAAGVQIVTNSNFGGSSSVVIRGMKSIAGNNQALFVIDGVPVNNTSSTLSSEYGKYDGGNVISDINPDDVESINILKGAAAAALYGERASAGVVVITTKKGKSKKDDTWGIKLSTEYLYGEIDKSTFAKYQNVFGGGYGSSFSNKNILGDGVMRPVVVTSGDASMGDAFDPKKMVYQWNSLYPQLPGYHVATPWMAAKHTPDYFFQKSQTTSNSISIEKSNNHSSIYLNYNNYLSSGVLPNSDLKKNIITSKFTYDLTDKLSATAYTTLTIQNTVGRNTTGYNDNIIGGFRQWWQTNVDMLDLKNAYFLNHENLTWNPKGYSVDDQAAFFSPAYWNNPYFERYQNYQSDNRTRFFGYLVLNYKFNKEWNLTGRMSTDFINQKNEQRLAIGSINQTFGLSKLNAPSGYYLGTYYSNEINFDLFTNYNKRFDNNMTLSGLIGTSLRRNKTETTDASTEGGLIIPGLYALRNSYGQPLPAKEYSATSLLPRAYGQISFGIDDTYYIEATSSVDRSSNLPKQHNVYFYPSVSGSVILSNLIKRDWLSFWKIRGNLAQVGKTTLNYGIEDTYDIIGIFGTGDPVIRPWTYKNNPDLRSERSNEIELGMEARFFKNRLGFDISAYKTNSKDQIMLVDVSTSSGYAKQWINAGNIQNKGIELQLNAVPFRTDKFKWDINLNWAKNQNKVISLQGSSTNLLLASANNNVTFNAAVGKKYGVINGTDFVYSPDGQKVVDDKGRYLTTDSNQEIGNITPDYTWSIRNSFSYKSFTFSFLIDGQKGGDIFSVDMLYGTDTGLYPETISLRPKDGSMPILPGVVEENGKYVSNTKPIATEYSYSKTGSVLTSVGYPSKQFVYDATFIKLREAAVYYDFPKRWFEGTVVKGAKVGLVGRNLWIIHKNMPYADPEDAYRGFNQLGVASSNLGRGLQIGSMPAVRTIGMSFSANF